MKQENNWEYNEAVHQLFIDFKVAYEGREVLYNILIEFGVPKKLEICLIVFLSRIV
jgi:hypothetical protein